MRSRLAMRDEAMNNIQLMSGNKRNNITTAETNEKDENVSYPLVVPADDLRAHFIPRQYGDFTDEVEVGTCRARGQNFAVLISKGRESAYRPEQSSLRYARSKGIASMRTSCAPNQGSSRTIPRSNHWHHMRAPANSLSPSALISMRSPPTEIPRVA